jgi:hypothetical protein
MNNMELLNSWCCGSQSCPIDRRAVRVSHECSLLPVTTGAVPVSVFCAYISR